MSAITDHPLDSEMFRSAMSQLPTGVVAITALRGDAPLGFVVGSFVSISLEPPLVGFFVAHTSTTWPEMSGAGTFCASVLAHHHHHHVRARFSQKGVDRFANQSWKPAPSGAPILDGALAWIDCELERTMTVGDHDLVVGRVTNVGSGDASLPMLFFRRSYGVFSHSEHVESS